MCNEQLDVGCVLSGLGRDGEQLDGAIESLALPRQAYAMALTPAMLSDAERLAGEITSTIATTEGGYVGSLCPF